MVGLLERWIDKTNHRYYGDRKPCTELESVLNEYFSASELESTYYVVVDKVPFPNIPMVKQAMSGGAVGITYKDTYYLVPSVQDDISIHFHELVHVLQWRLLGARQFIKRYLIEILRYGYQYAPLEQMAYSLQRQFSKRDSVRIVEYVKDHL